MKTRKHKTDRQKLTKALDTLVSLYCRTKAKHTCEKCGSMNRTQAHHIFTRSYKATRWHETNLICICWACHKNFFHSHIEKARDWIIERMGESEYYALKELAYSVKKHNIDELIAIREEYEGKLEELKNG